MTKTTVEFFLAAALAVSAEATAHATGNYSPPTWMEQGAATAEHPPEFFWEHELRKIAVPFKPSQERVEPALKPKKNPNDADQYETQAEQAARVDVEDYRDAIKKGLINEPGAEGKHEAARNAISAANEASTAPLPEEPSSEFRDYDMAAFAFHQGEKHYDQAAQIWEKLLQRPPQERHYRSVWAAFMLGKIEVYAQQPEAVKWFRMVRQLAKDGFADSLGLAADSYGWEAKSELDQDHLEKAAQLYLTQLAMGDNSAIVSLKALVPDRTGGYGMSFGPQPPENADEATLKKFNEAQEKAQGPKLERAAKDPLLRRLTSAHVLATETQTTWMYDEEAKKNPASERCERWLKVVEKAGLKNVEDAGLLGWVAYAAGRYTEAERWLKVGGGETSTALWLKAKLLRRAGKFKEAAAAMAAAWDIIQKEDFAEDETGQFTAYHEGGLNPDQAAAGELATLQLTRGDFVNAFETFVDGDLLFDAAFVAERVLTTGELKQYVDAHCPEKKEKDPGVKASASFGDGYHDKGGQRIRWMLGRRLVREDRYDEARPYLPEDLREGLDRYVKALKDGADEKLPKPKRARAWFDAATIARYSGMELMGTEGAPDFFIAGGDFEFDDVAGQRETGTQATMEFQGDKQVIVAKPVKLAVPVSAEEKKRLAVTRPSPNKRFHYRYVAAALGWKAAALLPDQSDELADVLNTSGGWIAKDDKAADKFFQALERRASKTPLGRKAGAKHWFVQDEHGPWSKEPESR